MKKIKLPEWKIKKRVGFRGYFTIFVAIILSFSVLLSSLFEKLISEWTQSLGIPSFAVIVTFTVVIGLIISSFVSIFALTPIKNVRDAMIEVSEGDFDVEVKEGWIFDEIEDVNHAFNVMVKELRSNEAIQTEFVANVSHEFKTPLAAVNGYATMLRDGDLTDEERKEYAEKILFNVNRLSELVSNVLLISKLDNQGIKKNDEEFFIDEQIGEAILLTERKWSEKGIDFDANLERVRFRGNRALFLRAWSNLIDNAIKFSPQNGVITLSLTCENDFVRFSVADEGEGIKESQAKNVFNKFYQADSSHKQEGNGLGLSLVKKIVEAYDGEVSFRNLEPKGCEFDVLLPLDL